MDTFKILEDHLRVKRIIQGSNSFVNTYLMLGSGYLKSFSNSKTWEEMARDELKKVIKGEKHLVDAYVGKALSKIDNYQLAFEIVDLKEVQFEEKNISNDAIFDKWKRLINTISSRVSVLTTNTDKSTEVLLGSDAWKHINILEGVDEETLKETKVVYELHGSYLPNKNTRVIMTEWEYITHRHKVTKFFKSLIKAMQKEKSEPTIIIYGVNLNELHILDAICQMNQNIKIFYVTAIFEDNEILKKAREIYRGRNIELIDLNELGPNKYDDFISKMHSLIIEENFEDDLLLNHKNVGELLEVQFMNSKMYTELFIKAVKENKYKDYKIHTHKLLIKDELLNSKLSKEQIEGLINFIASDKVFSLDLIKYRFDTKSPFFKKLSKMVEKNYNHEWQWPFNFCNNFVSEWLGGKTTNPYLYFNSINHYYNLTGATLVGYDIKEFIESMIKIYKFWPSSKKMIKLEESITHKVPIEMSDITDIIHSIADVSDINREFYFKVAAEIVYLIGDKKSIEQLNNFLLNKFKTEPESTIYKYSSPNYIIYRFTRSANVKELNNMILSIMNVMDDNQIKRYQYLFNYLVNGDENNAKHFDSKIQEFIIGTGRVKEIDIYGESNSRDYIEDDYKKFIEVSDYSIFKDLLIEYDKFYWDEIFDLFGHNIDIDSFKKLSESEELDEQIIEELVKSLNLKKKLTYALLRTLMINGYRPNITYISFEINDVNDGIDSEMWLRKHSIKLYNIFNYTPGIDGLESKEFIELKSNFQKIDNHEYLTTLLSSLRQGIDWNAYIQIFINHNVNKTSWIDALYKVSVGITAESFKEFKLDKEKFIKELDEHISKTKFNIIDFNPAIRWMIFQLFKDSKDVILGNIETIESNELRKIISELVVNHFNLGIDSISKYILNMHNSMDNVEVNLGKLVDKNEPLMMHSLIDTLFSDPNFMVKYSDDLFIDEENIRGIEKYSKDINKTLDNISLNWIESKTPPLLTWARVSSWMEFLDRVGYKVNNETRKELISYSQVLSTRLK